MSERICPDCKIRVIEYRCQYCSECAFIRRQIAQDIYRHSWRVNHPEAYRESVKKLNYKNREYKRQWKARRNESNV
jgi:hypothetical protein